MKELFNFPAGVDVVHIGIQNYLEHHPGVVRAAPAFLIQLSETCKIQALNQGGNRARRIVFCNILINSLRKKNGLVGIVRTKMPKLSKYLVPIFSYDDMELQVQNMLKTYLGETAVTAYQRCV